MSEIATRSQKVPTYRKHKSSGQAIVTLSNAAGVRRDLLLGKYGSAESRREYARVVAEWEAADREFAVASTSDISVSELAAAFWRHCQRYYRRPDGSKTSEVYLFKSALKPLKALYGHTLAAEFKPVAMKAIRQRWIDQRIARSTINKYTSRIRSIFRWAVGEGLIPETVAAALPCLAPLKMGRTIAREPSKIKPVPDAFVEAIRPHVNRFVWGMIELQRATGMRPGEACIVRAIDIDTTGDVWLYRPQHHKTSWRGAERVIALGPKAQAVIRQFLTLRTDDYLFSPKLARAERYAALRAARKTKVQPSQVNRAKPGPRRPGDHYTTASYSDAIARGCEQAGTTHWHPNQLRHGHGTMVRRKYGIEGAQVALGHVEADVTQIYAERDMGLAIKIAKEVG